jgi:hypothetical protein
LWFPTSQAVHDLIERTHRIQRERPHSLAVDSL